MREFLSSEAWGWLAFRLAWPFRSEEAPLPLRITTPKILTREELRELFAPRLPEAPVRSEGLLARTQSERSWQMTRGDTAA